MLKEKLIVDLNEEGSRALAEIMRVTGLKRSQVIHSVLKEWEARVSVARSAGNQGLEVLGLLSRPTPATAREVPDATSGSDYRTRTDWQPHTARVGFEGPTEENPTRGVSEPDRKKRKVERAFQSFPKPGKGGK